MFGVSSVQPSPNGGKHESESSKGDEVGGIVVDRLVPNLQVKPLRGRGTSK
jgi:hypothetical protein